MAKKPNIKLRLREKVRESVTAPAPETHALPAEVSQYYRVKKQQISIRLDADVLDWLKRQPGKYQSLINKVLREFMEKA